jgi:ribosome-binding factor A
MSIRTERVARLVQREVADVINTQFHEPAGQMATVTGARVTGDLSIAYIYVSCLGQTEQERANVFDRLVDLTPRIRSELGNRIRNQVRHIPELRFVHDKSLIEAARIEELLDVARRERLGRGDE